MNPTLLIAEGDPDVCELHRLFLAASGYQVEVSKDGLDCLEKLRQSIPNVLLLDWNLRWGGGDGLLAWLREESVLQEVPTIITSAGFPEESPAFLKPPVVACLVKPFSMNSLLESVRSAIAAKESEIR
jgi:two-component system phosphate regulon response regulator PhoB